MIVYGLVGWAAEVLWTAVADLTAALAAAATSTETWRLEGRTYLWMLPIYGLGGLAFERVHARLRRWPRAARGALYVVGIFAVEAASGALLRALTGRCPWDYGAARFAVGGLIRLDYAPLWLGFALGLERLDDALPRRAQRTPHLALADERDRTPSALPTGRGGTSRGDL
jgi:uncharacterized membrane protein